MSSDSADVLRQRRHSPPPPYSETDGHSNDMNNGPNRRDRTSTRPPNEHRAYQMFASLPAFAQAALSFVKYVLTWLFYKGLFGLLLLTPIGPIWLLYQKGLVIISYIPIAIQFAKDMGTIGKKCYDDAMNKTGYMDSKQLKRDLRAALLKALGYEYQKSEDLDDEIKDDSEDQREALQWDSTSKERFRDTVVYTVTLGNYPTYLTNRGIVPPTRQTHRTPHASKSRMTSIVLSCTGMAYYIVSGKFLFKNVHAIEKMEKDADVKRKESNATTNGEKKFNWKYIYATVIIAFGIWWIFSSHTEPGAHPYMNFFLSIFLSPFSFFIGNGYRVVMWTWSKFFAICFWFPNLILGSLWSSENPETPLQNDYAYAKQNVQ
jgi:hypothetical protein